MNLRFNIIFEENMGKVLIAGLFFWIFSISVLLRSQSIDKTKIAADYYQYLNQGQYNEIERLLSDSIKLMAGEYTVTDSKAKFKNYYQWDSVFSPNYHIISMDNKNDTVFASIEKFCKRIEFLYKKPLTVKQMFVFDNALINKIISIEDASTDWEFWMKNKNKLIRYIKTNHPEIADFENFQNKEYGERYLKAIKLYYNEK